MGTGLPPHPSPRSGTRRPAPPFRGDVVGASNTFLAISEVRTAIPAQAAFFASSRTSGASLSFVSPKRLPSEP